MRKTEEEQGARLMHCALGIVAGGAIALAVCLAFLLLAAFGIAAGILGETLIDRLALVGCVVGSLAGGLAAVHYCGRRSLLTGLLSGCVLFLLLLTVGVLFYQNVSFQCGGIGLLCGCLCGGAVAGLLGSKCRRRERRKKKHRK